MKEVYFAVFAVAFILSCAADSKELCGDNVEWSLNNGVLTINGTGPMYDYSQAPASLPPWFSSVRQITKVDVKEGVTSIGNYSFIAHQSVIEVTLPSSLTRIGSYSFMDCETLTRLTIPESVKTIEESAFYLCSRLVEINIPKGLTTISNFVFGYCSSLKQITIPDGVISIGEDAFSLCTGLQQVNIPDSVTTIENYAFFFCTNLTHVDIPDSVTMIGESAFFKCGLSSITIPDSVESIGEEAFKNCSNLAKVFYQGSKYFNSSAFKDCISLTDVCVSPEYKYDTFCGLSVTSAKDTCVEFRNLFNRCSRPSYNEGNFIQHDWKNVTDKDIQIDGCKSYKCNNGFPAWSFCNSAEASAVCLNNQCVTNDTVPEEEKAYVEIEINGFKIEEFNAEEMIVVVSELCNISAEELNAGYKIDKDGIINKVYIYVKDKETANSIADALGGLKVDENNCEYGILCYKKTIVVGDIDSLVSEAPAYHCVIPIFIMLLAAMMM